MNLDRSLAQLENSQLIRRAEDLDVAYAFKHTLSQETAYASLLVKKRREVHRQVAQSIERLYADHLDDQAALLAQHYAEAGDDAKTLEYATRAGDAAARIYANVEAVANYSLALDVAKKQAGAQQAGAQQRAPLQDLYLKRGRALELLSRFDDAARNYDEMEVTAQASGDRVFELAALIARATIRAIPGSARNPEQAQLLSERALEVARELGDRQAEAKILWNLLILNIYSGGNAEQAALYGERSLAIARELHLREQMAYSLHDLFVAYAYLGDMEKARAVRLESGEIWRELDNKPMLAESRSGLAVLEFLLGEFDQAIRFGQEGFEISRSIANLGGQGFSGYTLGLIYLERGEFTQAIKSLGDAIPITQSGGLEGNGISPYAILGFIHVYLGDVKRGLDLMHTSLGRASAQLPFQRMWLYALLTRIELLAGNLEAAQAAFREGPVVPSLENFARMFPPAAPLLYLSAGDLALAQKEYATALELIDPLLDRMLQIKMRAFVPEALYLKGQALLGQGKTDRALEAWREARAEAEAMGSRRMLWQILAASSKIEAQCGNEAQAAELRSRALEIIGYIAEHSPPEMRDSFLELPSVRNLRSAV